MTAGAPRTALVVEGGAMRGVFSVGVLDVFLETGFHPFDLAIGASAGACNLASHLAGQDGRNRRCYFELMTRREFIDLRRGFRGGSVVDLDWLWDTLALKEPLDVPAIVAQKRTELVVACTSARTGDAVYFAPRERDFFDVLKGSCALPLLYRGAVQVEGEHVVDGGVSDPIPVEEAYRRGARRIVVVRSRPSAVVKENGFGIRVSSFLLRDLPGVARAVERTAERYQRAVRFVQQPPDDCRVIEVSPPGPLESSRTTQDPGKLSRDYALGRKLGEDAIARFRALS